MRRESRVGRGAKHGPSTYASVGVDGSVDEYMRRWRWGWKKAGQWEQLDCERMELRTRHLLRLFIFRDLARSLYKRCKRPQRFRQLEKWMLQNKR